MGVDLFGHTKDEFVTAKERYGIWPTTVWPCDMSDQTTIRLKELIGDNGESRRYCFTKQTDDKSVYRGKVTESIFNPGVAAYLLNCYAPPSGVCLDPFAGGGTRAIMAAKHGLRYIGTEIRKNEVESVLEWCRAAQVDNQVEIVHGTATCLTSYFDLHIADMVLTCPPYYNLETYNGGAEDLSMENSYTSFLDKLELVIKESVKILKYGAVSCWIVGVFRDAYGALIPLHHDVTRLHREAGCILREEIILHLQNTGAMQRVGQFDKGHGYLVRVHEYALVFKAPG